MTKGTLIFVIGVVAVLISGIGYYTYTKMNAGQPVHYHAGIQVYVDDKLQDFSSIKYMTISPCTDHDAKKEQESAKELQNDKGHLHDNIGDVVHVHRSGGTWKDFFTNIHFTVPAGKPVFAFINGNSVEDIMNTPIKGYDSVVIFIGTRNTMKAELKKAVTIDHIKEIEKKSELCASGS